MWSLIGEEILGYIMDKVFNYHFSSNKEMFKWPFLMSTFYKSLEHNIKSYIMKVFL